MEKGETSESEKKQTERKKENTATKINRKIIAKN